MPFKGTVGETLFSKLAFNLNYLKPVVVAVFIPISLFLRLQWLHFVVQMVVLLLTASCLNAVSDNFDTEKISCKNVSVQRGLRKVRTDNIGGYGVVFDTVKQKGHKMV